MKTNLLKSIFISLILVMGVNNASAVDLYLRGFVSWDCWNDNHLVDRGNNIQSTYVSLTANTDYTFKVGDSNWSDNYNYGKNGNNTLSLGHEYKMAQKGGDLSFKPTETGVYLFSVNTSSWGLTITRVIPTAAAPAEVVNGTNKMFYIEGHAGLNYLLNSSKGKASTSYPLSYMGTSYVNTAADLTQYYYISNNPSGWVGESNDNIKSAKGGELFSHTSKTAAKTASTTPSISGNTLNISTTTNATTGVYGSLKLYIQYYINNNFTGVTYNSSTASYASIPAGGQTARTSTFDVSNLESDTYTLKTILTDGIIYYIADTDEFTVTNTRTITFGVKDGGGKVAAKVGEEEYTSSPISVEDGTKITFTATPDANNVFSKWVNGSGTQISTQNPYTHTVSSDATIKAVFLKPTTIYLKPSANWKQANARFAIYAFGGGGDKWVDMTPVGCNDEYYMVDVPAGYSKFKFVRLNPNADNYGWDDDVAWGQTDDLSIQNDGDNLWDMTKKMHLNIGKWSEDSNGRFAAYFFEQGKDGKWVSMFEGNESNVYYCDIPNGTYTHLILCRMNPGNSTNGWNNKWHQTGDIPLGVDNYYTITSWGTNGKNCSADGSYIMVGEWTKLDLPTITYNQPENGSVTVTTASGKAITTDSSVEFDTEIIVTVTPNAGYAVNTATITIGGKQQTLYSGENTVTVCGNTSINVSFKQKAEWYIIGIDDNWGLQEKYKFIDGRVYVDLGEKGEKADKTFKIAKASGSSIDNKNQYGNKTFQGHDNSHTLKPANNLGGDATIKMVHNGGYVFVWDEDTKKLTIEYPNVCFLHGEFNEWKDNEAHALHNQVAMVKLERNQEYEFKVADKGVYRTSNAYGTTIQASGTITMDDETAYNGDSRGWHNCKIKATVTGVYRFSYNRETHVLVITYPEGSEPRVDDYRLAYKNSAPDSFHPAHFIRKNTTASEKLDTVSFFVDGTASTPQIILQRCTAVANGVGTWADDGDWQDVAVEAAGVYNFVLKQTNSGDTHNAEIDMSKKHAYTGHYYIRTDAAAGGWKSFRQEGNKMTYSSYADEHEDFDHYFCEWVSQKKGLKNVSYTVANDYSYCISDTLHDDVDTNHPIIVSNNEQDKKGNLPVKNGTLRNANVRWGWDSKTNKIRRAYLSGSSNVYDRFLVVTGNEHLLDANGNALPAGTNGSPRYGLKANEDIFRDMGNWVYQVDVTASSNTLVNLTAKYNDQVQIFKGQDGTPNHQLLTSTSGSKSYKIRLMYDFKTNHLIVAWLADGSDGDLGADMMIIRENQEVATQIDFTGKTLSNVKYAYAVMTFTNNFVNGEDPIHARKHYWVSFPFDVNINEVFGFSEYMDHWILQLYDGQKRADEGWWYESGTFWKYITNKNYTLKKGVGYVLTLDLSKMGANSSVFKNTDEVSLYFPSTGEIGTISGTETVTTNVPEHTRTDKRENRHIYDSHWNIIGVPGFADISGYSTEETQEKPIINSDTEHGGGPSFYYEYLPASNSYQATTTENTFKTMYGYMVQYHGDLSWTTTVAESTPDKIAARRNSDYEKPEKVSLRLEIAQDDVMADQTFVQMQQEGASAEFDMNLDLTKIINSGANIYTLAGEQRIQSAGNALPMGEAIVPVGVNIATEGEYTFRMPDGTEGMVVELIDYETNTRTNLLLSDYIVTLPKGTHENRFALHIQPEKDVTTGVGNVGDEAKGIEKYLIDGKLIIRTAEGIFDAQGHRL